MTDVAVPPIDELESAFEGQLLRDGDDGYDEARRVWNGCFDRRPALSARCISTNDVQAAVDYGRQSGVTVVVRSGSRSPHSYDPTNLFRLNQNIAPSNGVAS